MQVFETFAHLFHPRHSNNHRPRILHPEGFLVLLLLVVIFRSGVGILRGVSSEQGTILGYSSSITPTQVVELTNKERVKAGTGELVVNKQLSDAALAKARDMFADQYWAHYSPKGKTPWQFMKTAGYRYTIAGENLARDFMESEDMMRAWMNSPTHKENIVNTRYKEIGIAVVDGVLNGTETTLVVQMFGSTAATRRTGAITPQKTPQPVATTAPVANSQALAAIDEVTGEMVNPEQAVEDVINQVDEVVGQDQEPPVMTENSEEAQPEVLATPELFRESVEYIQNIERPPLFSPLHLSKAVFLALVLLVIAVLIYDTMVIEKLNTIRFVGKNFAHIALFITILFLIIFFKGGVVGA